jgi:hypothetical protein
MLSMVQQISSFTYNSASPSSENQRQELKVLTALTTILAMDVEVVAAVVSHDGLPGQLEVIACPRLRGRAELTNPPLGFWQFVANRNPRRTEDSQPGVPRRDMPTIIDSVAPTELQDSDKHEGLLDFVNRFM